MKKEICGRKIQEDLWSTRLLDIAESKDLSWEQLGTWRVHRWVLFAMSLPCASWLCSGSVTLRGKYWARYFF